MTAQLPMKKPENGTMRILRRIGIAIGGGLVVLVGVVMLPLPGPGMVVILLGLGILSLEFAGPRRLLAHLKARARDVAERVRAKVRKP